MSPDETRSLSLDWVELQLAVPRDASREERNRAILTRLDESQLNPTYDVFAAIATIQDESVHPVMASEAEERTLRQHVDRFAEEFFSLAPLERRERWGELNELCSRYPALRRRLNTLERGLSVTTELPVELSEAARELAEQLLDWFPLWPGEQALRRRAWLVGRAAAEWSQAAKELKRVAPDIAGLFPDWIASVARPEKRKRYPLRRLTRAITFSDNDAEEGQSNRPIFRILLIFLFVRLGFILSDSGSSMRARYSSPANNFTQKQVESFQKYMDWTTKNPGVPYREIERIEQLQVGEEREVIPGKLSVDRTQKGLRLVFASKELRERFHSLLDQNATIEIVAADVSGEELKRYRAFREAIMSRQGQIVEAWRTFSPLVAPRPVPDAVSDGFDAEPASNSEYRELRYFDPLLRISKPGGKDD